MIIPESKPWEPTSKRRRYNSYTSTDSEPESCTSPASTEDMELDTSSSDSDMSVELSNQEPEIKNIDEGASVEESPEYAEDIDNYHRKLEVRFGNSVTLN